MKLKMPEMLLKGFLGDRFGGTCPLKRFCFCGTCFQKKVLFLRNLSPVKICAWITKFRQPRVRLSVLLSDERLQLLASHKNEVLSYENILRHEMPTDILAGKVKALTVRFPRLETLLILRRSEVIQKSFAVTSRPHEVLSSALERKVKELLPYAPELMTYGLLMERQENQAGGLLVAMPEQQLKESLTFLNAIGLFPNDVMMEDQILARLSQGESVLVLDITAQRMLAVFVRQGRLLFSRTCRIVSAHDDEAVADFFQEIAMAFVEINEKPLELILTGFWDVARISRVENYFSLAARRPISSAATDAIETVLSQSQAFDMRNGLSLLPRAMKIEKWNQERKKELKTVLFSFLLMTALVGLGFGMQLAGMERHNTRLDRAIQQLQPEVEGLRQMTSDLKAVGRAQASKERVLELIQQLSLKMPKSITLRHLGMEGRQCIFKGESPSHAALSQAVEALESIPFLHDVKLEHTRMRKRLNEEFFEFEVVGTWQI